MLKLIVTTLDMLSSLPIIMILFIVTAAFANLIKTNSDNIAFLSSMLQKYSAMQISVELGCLGNESIIPLNESCSACRIVTCNGVPYKMVVR